MAKNLQFKSLLVPIDFSKTSLKALDYAIALAEEFGSQIRLLHVLEFPTVFNDANPAFINWDEQVKNAAETRIATLADENIDELIPTNTEVRFGRAYRVICEIAKKQKCDLIVIGTHGFTGLKHLLLGSTAERVVRHAPCSVLTVRTSQTGNAKSVRKPRQILVPTDFSTSSDAAFDSAVVLAKQYQSQLHLLHVVPVHYAVGEYDEIDYRLLELDEMEASRKKLLALEKRLLAKKMLVKTETRRGRPATEIVQAANEAGVDLMAISTHGLTGWRHLLLGSTTEEVVRHANCPVLVVRKK